MHSIRCCWITTVESSLLKAFRWTSIIAFMQLHTLIHPLIMQELVRIFASIWIIFLDLPSRYYKYEQTTQLRYIHLLQMRIRNVIIKILLIRIPKSELQLRYKLMTLINYYYLTPWQIEIIIKNINGVSILKSNLHSYDSEKNKYPQLIQCLIGKKLAGNNF